MKKKIKWIILAIIVIGIIGAVAGGNDEDTIDSSTASSQESSEQKNVDNENSDNGMNQDKFNQIQTGMSYEEVKNIVGEDGQNISESEIAGIKTIMYQWETDDWGIMLVTFQNDKVTNKSQSGISSDSTKVTLDQYNQIQTGMTYEEVKNILGGEGQLSSETEIAGMNSQIYQWNGNSLGANCMITFSDGKVYSKAQFGLE